MKFTNTLPSLDLTKSWRDTFCKERTNENILAYAHIYTSELHPIQDFKVHYNEAYNKLEKIDSQIKEKFSTAVKEIEAKLKTKVR